MLYNCGCHLIAQAISSFMYIQLSKKKLWEEEEEAELLHLLCFEPLLVMELVSNMLSRHNILPMQHSTSLIAESYIEVSLRKKGVGSQARSCENSDRGR